MKNKFITSMQNPIIKNITLLKHKKSERKKQNLFIIEGIRSVNEIPAHYEVAYYITTDEFDIDQIKHFNEERWIVVTDEIYKAISDTMTPQGVMAIVKIHEYSLMDITNKPNPFYLVLENIQDPGNLGTIIRTAYGFGVDAVFLTKGCCDLYSPKTVRSTMGAVFHVPIIMDVMIEECLTWFKEKEIKIYATALEDSEPIFKKNFTTGGALVIGNEGNGISEVVRELADEKISIPMPGGLESLNASIAASICMYEIMKQKHS
ncbi:MAG: TrmH family RNA methyltransferase [Cellulosilyticaceae bacterium]